MKTSRSWFLAVVFVFSAGATGAQSMPKDLAWTVAELSGGGEWAVRFPQLLVRGWESLPEHRLSEEEQAALRQQFLDATVVGLDQKSSKAVLDLDKRRLMGPLPSTEPAATEKLLTDLKASRDAALAGRVEEAKAPEKLPFRPVWNSSRENQPWGNEGRNELLVRTSVDYLVTGSIRSVGSYLWVRVELYSRWEKKVLAEWSGQFAPEEAPEKAAEAADRFRSSLLGRPWSGLSVVSGVSGAKVQVLDQWHNLPWSTDELEPATLELRILNPGRAEETRTVVLEPESRTSLVLDSVAPSLDPIVLETEPPGVALYLDSRYLGPSPQTVDRPLATSRVRAQAEGWTTAAWEIGPQTLSPSRVVLSPPGPVPSVAEAKDRFYFSLAGFSISLTSTAFLGAWWAEQAKLQAAYIPSITTSSVAYENYKKAYDRYWYTGLGYAIGIGLTSGVFVWMMIELRDYLGIAQASLP